MKKAGKLSSNKRKTKKEVIPASGNGSVVSTFTLPDLSRFGLKEREDDNDTPDIHKDH